MRYQKDLIAPMAGIEVANRAQYVLGKWRYKHWAIPGGIRFERSYPFSGFFVINPHHVHSRIDMKIMEQADGTCRVLLDQTVFKYGQPSSNLDKIVWKGDLDDVEDSLTRRVEPSIDRTQQDKHAGKITAIYILSAILPPMALGAAVGIRLGNAIIGGAIALGLIFIAAVLLPHLPFKMPHFPLENVLPPPPGGSNYLRSGQDSR